MMGSRYSQEVASATVLFHDEIQPQRQRYTFDRLQLNICQFKSRTCLFSVASIAKTTAHSLLRPFLRGRKELALVVLQNLCLDEKRARETTANNRRQRCRAQRGHRGSGC